MKRAFEAVWEQGQVIPVESIRINDHTRLLVVILDEQIDSIKQDEQTFPSSDWRSLQGKYKGKLSSVDQFIQSKHEEKMLER